MTFPYITPTYIFYDFVSTFELNRFFFNLNDYHANLEPRLKFRSELFVGLMSYRVATIKIVEKFVGFHPGQIAQISTRHILFCNTEKQEVISYFQDIIIPPRAYAQRRLRNLRYL